MSSTSPDEWRPGRWVVAGLCSVLAACGGSAGDEDATVGSSSAIVQDSAPQIVTLTVAPDTTQPLAATGSTVGSLDDSPVALLVDGVFVGTESADVNGTKVSTALFAPQLTAAGVVVEEGRHGDRGPIRIVTAEETRMLGTGFGAAIDPGGTQVAWSRAVETGLAASHTLVLTDLASGEVVAEGPTIDTFAEPNGWVGDQVLVSTGDGAVSGTVLWDPVSNILASAATTDEYPDVQRVYATHPLSELALVGIGDGGCWAMVDYTAEPTKLFETPDCVFSLWAGDFSPSGTQLAMAEAGAGPQASAPRAEWDVTLSVLDSRTGERRASIPVVAPVQIWWESDITLLVLSNPEPAAYQVDRCSIDLVCEVLWKQYGIKGGSEAAGEPPRVWMVEQR